MRILFLTPYVAWPLDHGGRIRTHHLLHALAGKHDVVNLAVARGPAEREDAKALSEIGIAVTPCLLPERDMTLAGPRLLKWLSVAIGRSSLPGRWRGADFAAIVKETAANGRFDLAVIDTLWMDAYRPELRGIPYVASTQNVESDVLLEATQSSKGLAAAINRRDARLLLEREAAFLAGSAAAVAVSNDDAGRMKALAPDSNVAVILNGVDAGRLRQLPPPPPGGPLLFVGSFDYRANVDAAELLVKTILPVIRSRMGNVNVILAGRRPPPAIHALSRIPGVEVAGSVADLVPLYARASAVVVPLRIGGGSRIKILEALALGRPVVTTTAGMRGLDVRDGVHVLVADTPEAFCAALERLRGEPALAGSLAASGRALVSRNHSWAAIESQFLDLVDGLGSAGR